MKKRVIALLLGAACVATLMAGCGKKNTSNTNTNAVEVVNASIDLITDWEDKATITIGDKVSIDGTGATEEDGVIVISEGGAYTVSGSGENVSFLVDTDADVKIVLNGVEIENDMGPVIYGYQSNSLYIETTEGTENILTDGEEYELDEEGNSIGKGVISSNDRLVFLGSGTLTATGNYKHCLVSDDDLYMEGGNYKLVSNGTDGVHANDLVCVDAGNIDIEAASDCIQSEADLVIHGGSIVASSADEGIESKANMTIAGGTIAVTAVDDGLNAGSSIVIDDGDINIHTTTGDAVDSNGTIEINGGELVAYGGGVPEGALDCDAAEIVINGGTILAIGDANSAISGDSQQVSVLLGQYSKNDVIAIVDSDGTEMYSFTLEEAKSNIVLSLSELKKGETYAVTVNGTEERTFTVEEMVVSAGGTASQMGGGPGEMNGGQRPDGDGQMQMPDGNGERPDMSGMDGDRPEMPEGGRGEQMPNGPQN